MPSSEPGPKSQWLQVKKGNPLKKKWENVSCTLSDPQFSQGAKCFLRRGKNWLSQRGHSGDSQGVTEYDLSHMSRVCTEPCHFTAFQCFQKKDPSQVHSSACAPASTCLHAPKLPILLTRGFLLPMIPHLHPLPPPSFSPGQHFPGLWISAIWSTSITPGNSKTTSGSNIVSPSTGSPLAWDDDSNFNCPCVSQ